MAIRPTFYGFEMARMALFASQRNIDVAGHNIANMNTEGYSRQRANMSAIGVGNLNWKHPVPKHGNVGMGVSVDNIQRVRDEFLDVRFWKENSDNHRYSVKYDSLNSVEMLLDEFTLDNMDAVFSDLSAALTKLHEHSETPEFASQVRMISQTFCRTVGKLSSDLSFIRTQNLTQMELITARVNEISKHIAVINAEIRAQAVFGTVSNDLLDQRDLMIDELSTYGNVRRVPEPVFSQEKEMLEIGEIDKYSAIGGFTIYFGLSDDPHDEGIMLVDGLHNEYSVFHFDRADFDPYDPANPARITWGERRDLRDEPVTSVNEGEPLIVSSGMIMGFYEMTNGIGNVLESGETLDLASKGIPYFVSKLDTFVRTFVEEFNTINEFGDLFESYDGGEITAANVRISEEWSLNPMFITRSTITGNSSNQTEESDRTGAGRNDNMLRFIEALRKDMEIEDDVGNTFTGSLRQFLTSFNSDTTIEVSSNDRLLGQSDVLLLSIENLRASVKNVSQDEEAINLAKFQKSYGAASRFMTTLDEMLDLIVHRLGIVGR